MKIKDAMRHRWTTELSTLCDHHWLRRGKKGRKNVLPVGDVVIVNSKEQNQSFWLLGLVEQLTAGKDGVVQGAKLRVGQSNVKRPVQLLYPLELSFDESNNQETAVTLNRTQQSSDPGVMLQQPRNSE